MNAAKIYENALRDFYTGVITLQQFEERIRILRDVEPVIRCKDCASHRVSGLCKFWSRYGTITTRDDGFCAWGVRRSNDRFNR